MKGDIIYVKPEYFSTAERLVTGLEALPQYHNGQRLVVFICGESGSGKSVTAICLGKSLGDKGITSSVLHLDDYFKLPPISNHEKRLEDISWVGPGEVRLDLLQQHVDDFLNGNITVEKPLMHYRANATTLEELDWNNVQVLIVEGTYTFFLERAHYRIFMSRNYHDTFEQRMARGRDVQSNFVESVLEIEHNIIAPKGHLADATVLKDYSVAFNPHP